ncbi:MAG: type II secretion system protein GspL [Burkholderiaceae bacterium]
MTTLTLVLPLVHPTAGTEFDYVLGSDRGEVMSHGCATLALLPRSDVLVMVVPVGALSWHPVRLPPLPAGRLRAALEGLLEDKLLDEPARLALALAPRRPAQGDTLVAAFDKAWIRAMLEFFEQAGRPAARVVPEFAPLSNAADAASVRWQVIGTPEDARLVLVQMQGPVCLPLASAPALLGTRLAADAEGRVLAEPAVAALAEQVMGTAVQIQARAQRLCDAAAGDWELAQFDLSLSGGGRLARRWRQQLGHWLQAPQWRAARWGLVALLLAHVLGFNAWAWKLDALVRDKQQQVRNTLAQAFPEIRTIVDAPLQMQRQLDLLRQSSGGLSAQDMETMLGVLGAALPAGIHASAIDYAPGQLTLRGLALAEPVRAKLADALADHGYRVQLDGERLVMRAGGAP